MLLVVVLVVVLLVLFVQRHYRPSSASILCAVATASCVFSPLSRRRGRRVVTGGGFVPVLLHDGRREGRVDDAVLSPVGHRTCVCARAQDRFATSVLAEEDRK